MDIMERLWHGMLVMFMKGGAGQMNTIYSWGTLKDTGIISDLGTAVIN